MPATKTVLTKVSVTVTPCSRVEESESCVGCPTAVRRIMEMPPARVTMDSTKEASSSTLKRGCRYGCRCCPVTRKHSSTSSATEIWYSRPWGPRNTMAMANSAFRAMITTSYQYRSFA